MLKQQFLYREFLADWIISILPSTLIFHVIENQISISQYSVLPTFVRQKALLFLSAFKLVHDHMDIQNPQRVGSSQNSQTLWLLLIRHRLVSSFLYLLGDDWGKMVLLLTDLNVFQPFGLYIHTYVCVCVCVCVYEVHWGKCFYFAFSSNFNLLAFTVLC